MRRWISLLLLVLAFNGQAAIEVHEFESAQQRERFQALAAELRCPMCQNQNILGSNAPIAADMRDEVYRRMQAGQSDDEIVAALVERFGEFVHYRPALNVQTALLWFGPLVLLMIGMTVILAVVRRNRRAAGAALTAEERAAIDSVLREDSVDTGRDSSSR